MPKNYKSLSKGAKKLLKETEGGKDQRPIYSANFLELCDIVLNDNEVKFLTFNGNVIDQYETDEETLQPPPIQGLPPYLTIPRAKKVLSYAQKHGETGVTGVTGVCKGCSQLFNKLIDYHQNISELPNEDLYLLLSLWDVHTYLIEKFNYSPIIYFYSVAERGKSRTLKGMTYVAYRGIRKGDIRDAQLIRDCTHLRASLAFDMMDFWEKVKQAGSQDVILNRYEKGTTVSRVNRPEKGAFQDTDYYDVFGPTILATNEIIHDIADTRSIPIVMRKADRDFENEVTPEMGYELKEELTAFRLMHFNDELPKINKIARSRLGDIVKPLHQTLLMLDPNKEEQFRALIENIEKTRLTEKSSTIDAEIVQAWIRAKDIAQGGVVPSQKVADAFNEDRDEKERLNSRKIGNRLASFGFTKTKTSDNTLGFFLDEFLTEKLMKEYGVLGDETPVSPVTPVSPDSSLDEQENMVREIFK